MSNSVGEHDQTRVAKIIGDHGAEIDSEFKAILERYGVYVRESRYSGDWKCTIEGATVPCGLLSWVFDL